MKSNDLPVYISVETVKEVLQRLIECRAKRFEAEQAVKILDRRIPVYKSTIEKQRYRNEWENEKVSQTELQRMIRTGGVMRTVISELMAEEVAILKWLGLS